MAKIYSRLTFTGADFDANLITVQAGVAPTLEYKQTNVSERGDVCENTIWMIETIPVKTNEVDLSLCELIKKIPCEAKVLKEISDRFCGKWNCTVVIEFLPGFAPNIILSSKTISFLAEIGSGLHFDEHMLENTNSPMEYGEEIVLD